MSNNRKKMLRKQTNKQKRFNKLYSWSLQGEASDLKELTICGDYSFASKILRYNVFGCFLMQQKESVNMVKGRVLS